MSGPSSSPAAPDHGRAKVFAATVSLVCGTAIFVSKLVAWKMTGSSAVLSDALESIANVIAAIFALFAVRVAAQPADRDHPYGHGKIEFLSAAFEGGLVSFAAAMIGFEAVRALVEGSEVRSIDVGLLVTAAAGGANLALGAWLVRRGRATGSATLVADGQHVLSDVWTTLGVLVGLALVRLTGLKWLDPVAALFVGGFLALTGWRLVREGSGALIDEKRDEVLERIVQAANRVRIPGFNRLHRLRALRFGSELHVDAHVFVPAHWTTAEAHDAAQRFEVEAMKECGLKGEIALHLDPCLPSHCSRCELAPCPRRSEPFAKAWPVSLDEAVGDA